MFSFRARQLDAARRILTIARRDVLALIATASLLAGPRCSGPQPLATAIRPADQNAYVQRLNAANYNGRTAYFAWIADEKGTDAAAMESRDRTVGATKNPFDAYRDATAVSRGAVIYKLHCARCHGEDARGRGPAALPGHPATDFHDFGNRFASTLHRGAPRRWFKSISEGYGDTLQYPDGPSRAMPAFGDTLAREQIWLVITYLQSLDARKPAANPAPGRAQSNTTTAPGAS